MSDVEIDKAALEGAIANITLSLGTYVVYANDIWARDTGVGNPAGRTGLRVMLENALGQATLEARAHHLAGTAIADRLQSINDSFTELDVSMTSGWDAHYVADLA
ncbi:MAG TPA: hypothetical protein VN241_05825 [Microbacterium sp.]|uniref:hypothetical protein n=1 Tax=Microbacterium sp. TaxID=51671 RepID=UPI0028116947|nr:hypothetical protein [Microbacterium sp.]HWS50509.1 hypothetical protein [Microbacterium sp.]